MIMCWCAQEMKLKYIRGNTWLTSRLTAAAVICVTWSMPGFIKSFGFYSNVPAVANINILTLTGVHSPSWRHNMLVEPVHPLRIRNIDMYFLSNLAQSLDQNSRKPFW